jgi:hypothetical protein
MSDNTVAGTQIEPPAPVNETDNLDARIAAAVEARVARVASDYDRKIRALEERYSTELKNARGVRPVDHLVPTHGGGLGNEIHQVWSQYHQDLANAGLLTDDHIRQTNGLYPAEDGESVG